jgi:octaprenyl-diphosphate synthase
MCVLLAAKLAGPAEPAAFELALAAELVHSATLLHDDVVDSGDLRRGKPTARVLYGNAASIFAGDWLLVAALRLIRQVDSGPLLDKMLSVLNEMILAESVQLENRGRLNAELGDYFAVVEGKTASLFRWAMYAGAFAAGLPPEQCAAADRFGLHLGVAFQAVDDLLDVDGDALVTGKTLFADLRDGKITYPLIVALSRRPALAEIVARYCEDEPRELSHDDARSVIRALRETDAVAECRALARQRALAAKQALSVIEDSQGKQALITIADTTIHRDQ